MRIFVAGQRMYIIGVIRRARGDTCDDTFFDSFALITAASASTEPAAAGVAHEVGTITCSRSIDAYDPSDPGRKIGIFKKDTVLKIRAKHATSEMYHVTWKQSAGSEIHALCRAGDLGR